MKSLKLSGYCVNGIVCMTAKHLYLFLLLLLVSAVVRNLDGK
jgi:hypothetical protein